MFKKEPLALTKCPMPSQDLEMYKIMLEVLPQQQKASLSLQKKGFCHPEAAPTAKKGHDMFLSMN